MRKVIMAGLAVVAIAALAWASDPWKKPYQQWDKKDVQKILDDSPWAKTVNVTAKWEGNGSMPPMNRPEQQPQPTAPPPSSGSGGGRPGMGGGGGGGAAPGGGMQPGVGGGGGGGGIPVVPFVVRWVSARTMREAYVRSAELSGSMTESQATAELGQSPSVYQVLVAGPQMLPFEQSTEGAVKSAAYLQVKKSKQKIEPVKVEFQRSADGSKVQAVVISFPKTAGGQPTIPPDAKGAEFFVEVGQAKIHTNFDFSKMNTAQGRDL